jgi:hypothetical protein
MQRARLKISIFFFLLFSTIVLWNNSPVWASPGQSPNHQTVPTRVKSKTPTSTVKPGTPSITPTEATTSVPPSQTATARPGSLTPTQIASARPGQSTNTPTPSDQATLSAPTSTGGAEPPTATPSTDTPTPDQASNQTQLASTRQFNITLTIFEETASQSTIESLTNLPGATDMVQSATPETRPSIRPGVVTFLLPICGIIAIIMGVVFFIFMKRRSRK